MQDTEEHQKLSLKISEQAKKIAKPLEETDEDSLKKLLSQQPYTKENIAKCAEYLLTEQNYNYNQQFSVIENLDVFDQIFEQRDQSIQPHFFSYNKGEDSWILLCLVKDENQKTKILYKDPFSDVVDKELELKICSKIEGVQIVINSFKESKEEKYLYGPTYLRNLKTLMKALKQDTSTAITKFDGLQFPTTTKVFNDRLRKALSLTVQLAENEEFLLAIKKYTDILPLKFYFEAMNSRNSNYAKPENALYFQSEQQIDDFDKVIQQKFPEELENLDFIVKTIFEVPEVSYMFRLLQTVCVIFKLDFDKIMSTFMGDFVDAAGKKHSASSVLDQVLEVESPPLEILVNQIIAEIDSYEAISETSAMNESLEKEKIGESGNESDFCSGEEDLEKIELADSGNNNSE